jgi:TonB family protein
MNARRWCGVLGAWCVVLGATAVAQDSLSNVRDLYASAAYEDALTALGKLPAAPRSSEEARAIEQYRAFCLLALGRSAEAEHAIETVVQGQPMYRPVDSDMSPRVRAAFIDVRKRMLPTIIEQRYGDAKAAFDRREFQAASQGFQQVLDLMNDPDVAGAVAQPPLSDMRLLAKGFHDLSVSAAVPPPLPTLPMVTTPTPKSASMDLGATPVPVSGPGPNSAPSPAFAPATGTGVAPGAPVVYVSGDSRVVPPVIIHQELPAFPGVITIGKQGIIEVVIDENGLVESAVMRASVSPNYDALAIAATKTWRYKPAVANGVPVKFRKAVQITVRAQRP